MEVFIKQIYINQGVFISFKIIYIFINKLNFKNNFDNLPILVLKTFRELVKKE